MIRFIHMPGKKSLFLTLFLLCFYAPSIGMEISLKLSGGMNFMPLENVNSVLQEWIRFYKTEADQKPSITFLEGDIPDFKTTVNLGGELAFTITPWLTLSMGTGLSHLAVSQEKTTLMTERPIGTYSYIHPMKISVMPLTFSAYVSFKISEKLKAYARGGGGLAWLKYVERSARRNITRNQKFQWLMLSKSTSRAPILMGGLGLLYRIEPGIDLFVEGLVQKTKFTDISGVNIDEENGTLYHLEQYSNTLDVWFETFRTYVEEPSGETFRSVRKAEIDFSGFSFKIGLMIRF